MASKPKLAERSVTTTARAHTNQGHRQMTIVISLPRSIPHGERIPVRVTWMERVRGPTVLTALTKDRDDWKQRAEAAERRWKYVLADFKTMTKAYGEEQDASRKLREALRTLRMVAIGCCGTLQRAVEIPDADKMLLILRAAIDSTSDTALAGGEGE